MPGQKAHEETRRQDILRAAHEVALRDGAEALTLRAVAKRAGVSHGTVLFHFKRRDDLVASLLERVLGMTARVEVSDGLGGLTTPSDRLHALLRAEMDRLSADPRHFRLFLEYWTLGVRTATIRKRIGVALEEYRASFRPLADAIMKNGDENGTRSRGRKTAVPADNAAVSASIAAVAVSLVHGCALQSVIDPKGFDVQQHFAAAARMLERLAIPGAA
jgi:AcrR family transcriptional regulator